MHLSVRHFRYFLGQNFVFFTDHKPLIFAFFKVSDAWSARQPRQLSAISEFTADIRHVAGKNNFVADALFRSMLSSISTNLHDLDFEAMVRAPHHIEVQAYRTALFSLQVKEVPVGPTQASLLCDISTGTPRPISCPTIAVANF